MEVPQACRVPAPDLSRKRAARAGAPSRPRWGPSQDAASSASWAGRGVLGLFMPAPRQEEGARHANHFLLSRPRSPEALGWGDLKEADAGPHAEQGQLGEEPLRDGAMPFSNCAPMTW